MLISFRFDLFVEQLLVLFAGRSLVSHNYSKYIVLSGKRPSFCNVGALEQHKCLRFTFFSFVLVLFLKHILTFCV